MPQLLRIFFTGMMISFLGTLPLGTLNVAAMQISISDGIRPALYFSIGALLVEVAYVRVSLVAIDWVRKNRNIFIFLEWLTLIVIVALAVSSFVAATGSKEAKNVILSNTMHRFWLGMAMSAVNPMQIPFWFGWSNILFTRRLLLPRKDFYNSYTSGIGFGTLIGHCIFIFGGRLIVEWLNAGQHLIQWIIGSIFSITAIIQAWKMFRHRDAISKMG